MKVTYRFENATTTEPIVGLGWDFKTDGPLTMGVIAFGTQEQIDALSKTALPSYEEVRARELRQPTS